MSVGRVFRRSCKIYSLHHIHINTMPETIKSLKKENDDLKIQIESLQKNFEKLQNMIESNMNSKSSKQNDQNSSSQTQLHGFQNSLEFLSDKYDTLNAFEMEMKNELKKLNSRLTEITNKVNQVGDALEQLEEYSFQYNIKIIGLAQQNERETAHETSSICVDLFKLIGAEVNLNDIDIAHRVPSRRRNQDNKPNPIVCKFVRRLSKEGVMRLRKEAIKVNPSVRIFDHLTPKNQKILYEAKAFKEANSYEYCWTKNSRVYLRKNATSRAIRINRLEDLHSLRE